MNKILSRYYIDYQWICGETYESLEWFDTRQKPTEEELNSHNLELDEIRDKRNELLKETDFRALPDYPDRDKWILYRQQLRDFPSIWTNEMDFPEVPT
jgi:hypothetical protein